MPDLAEHIIHTAAGRLHPKATTTHADVVRIVQKACASGAAGGIVVHFHGGLVSESSGRTSAKDKLYPLYATEANAYPIFFIWESGFFEAPLNNLREIARESLFREFVKKSAVWMLKKIGGGLFKGAALGSVDETKLKRELDDWFAGRRAQLPEQLELVPGADDETVALKTKGVAINEDELVDEIEASISEDEGFKQALEETYNGLHAGATPKPSTKGTGSTVATNSLISKEAAERLFDATPGATKGVLSWFKAAKAVAAVVIRVIRRARRGRSHGRYVTLVEETLRELYVDKLGREVWWERMKGDTSDAFREGEEYGGTAFLFALRQVLATTKTLPKITLVGHSTGAIYICNLLRAANRILPEVKFDVIFEAPAVSYDVFAQTLAEQASSIRFFRSFGMDDEREGKDDLVPILYPASLLYFVSGMLERQVDLPLVGMQRYLNHDAVFGTDDFWSIEVCRKFFARHPEALIWAPREGAPGCSSTGRSHGDFDDVDPVTLKSVAHIIRTQPK
jgi:hypothetical protein